MQKKIIMVNSCQGLYGGVESFLLNIFRYLNKKEFDITLLTCGISTYDMFREEIIESGGHINTIPIYANTLGRQMQLYKELCKYFQNQKPDIVHINSGGLSFHLIAGKAAKDASVKYVILHSHNFVPERNDLKEKIKNVLKKAVVRYGNKFLACSMGAAKWIFPDTYVRNGDVEIIPNGIDTDKFAFDNGKRTTFRKEMGLGEELVVGNIGRFQLQKNHKFIARIMSEVKRSVSEAKLLLVGKGELQEEIKNYVRELELTEHVIFLDERKDMDYFLSAIDVFILPSLHEGFPISAVEAQASGAKVLLADTITKETDVTGRVKFLPIRDNLDERLWAKCICECDHDFERSVSNYEVAHAGYDIENYCNRMEQIYREV